MSHIHLNLGNDILRAEVRAHIACLAHQLPNAEFNLVITGASLSAILGNTGDLVVNAAPAPVTNVVNTTQAPVVAPATTKAPTATGERFRRTNEETAAGLTVDEAKAFRATGGTDPVAYKASLAPAADAGDTGVVTPKAEEPAATTVAEAPASEPKAAGPVTEQDVRDAAAKAVQNKRVDDVKKIAAEYGVKNWKELDPSKLGEVLTKLTALIVVG